MAAKRWSHPPAVIALLSISTSSPVELISEYQWRVEKMALNDVFSVHSS
jgi:hypothetical protein